MSDQPLISEYADDPVMTELVADFIDGLVETCRRLREYIEAGDVTEIRRIGHQMKGAGAGYGYPSLTDAGAALERAVDAEGNVTENVRRQADVFLHYCSRALLGGAFKKVGESQTF